MNIWHINPFSDLPDEGASEGRFCCLARMLVEQAHDVTCPPSQRYGVTWWSADKCMELRGEGERRSI